MKPISIFAVALLCGYLVKQHFGIPEGPGMPRNRVPEADMAKLRADYAGSYDLRSGMFGTSGVLPALGTTAFTADNTSMLSQTCSSSGVATTASAR